MVGGEILSRMGLEAKTVECLELLDRLLPNGVELVVDRTGGSSVEKGEICRITVRLKSNHSVLYAKTDRLEGLWSCIWLFYQREAEDVVNKVLGDFGRVRYLKCLSSNETYPLDDVPRFSSQDEFRMKVMLKGGAE